MTEAEFKKHLEAAERSPREIAAAVSGMSGQGLLNKPSPEKWCVLEVLGHLADVEIIYGYRLRQMLADTNPVIAPIDQDAWARNLNYRDSPASELVAFYGLARHHNLRLLRSLRVSDLSKSAFHPQTQTRVTVADLVEKMAKHGAAHLQQIAKLKGDAGGAEAFQESTPVPHARLQRAEPSDSYRQRTLIKEESVKQGRRDSRK